MAAVTYEKQIAALVVINPYNDFISEGGKIWNRFQFVAEANDCVPHMLQVLNAARNAPSVSAGAARHVRRSSDPNNPKSVRITTLLHRTIVILELGSAALTRSL